MSTRPSLSVAGNRLILDGKTYRCAIGKGGFSANKHEGDGCTPLGVFPLRECWYRADRLSAPQTGLPLRVIREDDGWCDDPRSAEYNRHVMIRPPQGVGGYERLFRDDHVYDLIIPIGYNDDPVVAGKGSAIFMHVARGNYEPTEGCVALKQKNLLEILPYLDTQSLIDIRAA